MDMRELRKSKKLTQAEFAKTIGLSGAAVSALETGRMKTSEKVLEKIKEVYGVEITAPKRAKRAEDSAVKADKRTKPARKGHVELIIQSPLGGMITPEEILAKVGEVDQVYVRVDENKAYWVKGEENGSVSLW